ncbi:MAG: GTP cyclohydrolase FolE2 [Bacillota bacterium]|jgi:GTP cyclohydrolase I|nr:GTP cyclohydrolase I FolE2 [Bacillota bacterium]
MQDVQSRPDSRGIDIQHVGVKNVHLPLKIAQKGGGYQSVLGNVSLSVDLPMQFKGTHMSRFIEVLYGWSGEPLSNTLIAEVLKDTCAALAASRAQIVIRFKYFVNKQAPVSRKRSVLDYNCEFIGELDGGKHIFTLGVEVPVTSCCPCSKEISDYGAHNQRTMVRARVRFSSAGFLWIEDLIQLLEATGSCEIYPLLKREDEKYVTEKAYENPKFVEDILRDVVLALRAEPRVRWFSVECESFESIHNHSAFANHTETKAKETKKKGEPTCPS